MKPGPFQKILASLFLLLFLLKPLYAFDVRNHPKYVFNSRFKAMNKRFLIELDDAFPESFLTAIPTEYRDQIKVHKEFTHELFRGLSIEILDQEHAVLRSMLALPNIASVSPNRIIQRAHTISLQDDHLISNQTISSEWVKKLLPHRSSQVNKVHQELNLTGEGIFIGVIDTAVDYNLKALGGGFGPGFKIAAGYDLVGDNYNASDPASVPKPSEDPLDTCNKSNQSGHGTHVSGIIAGNDPEHGFVGVAPGAKLGVWRVFSCLENTGTLDEFIIEAILRAYDAGVHVISLSLGGGGPWSDDRVPAVKLLNTIATKGVHVIVAAGNEGHDGAFTVTMPAESVFSVASVINEYKGVSALIEVNGISTPIGCAWAEPKVPDGELAISFNGTNKALLEEDACKPSFVSSSVKGKIALVKRGTCTFTEKFTNIKAAGGLGVIIYNDIPKDYDLAPAYSGTEGILPSVMISYEDGQRLLQAFKQTSPTRLKFSYNLMDPFIPNESASTISYFSSVGPSAELTMKPDIAAVGDAVYSTLPGYLGGYGFQRGTSMACPYIAGSIALYLQYHGVNSSSASTDLVFQKFKNYAFQTSVGNASSGIIDSTLRQGAGLVQVYDSIMQVVHVNPAQISFNDTSTQDYTMHNLTITNNGMDSISYRLYNNVSIAIAPYNVKKSEYTYVSQGLNTEAVADIQFSATEIHLKPGETQYVTVVVNPPLTDPLDHIMYSGFIQFYPFHQIRNNASLVTYKPLHIPYVGVVGSQHDLPIFDPNVNIITFDMMHNETYPVPTNITFDLTSDARLYHNITTSPFFMFFQYRLVTPTTILKAEVLQWPQEQVLGHIYGTDDFLQRYTEQFPANIAAWDGYYLSQSSIDSFGTDADLSDDLFIPVSSGDYVIRLSALKVFGDERKETDWETWVSGVITIIQR